MRHKSPPIHSTEPIELEIEKVVYGGDGLGHYEGQVVFVPFTVPGDRVAVRPVERKKGYMRAAVDRLLQPGKGRTSPCCPHFGSCGGCQWQHMDYALQLETKKALIEELFRHRFPEADSLPIRMISCPSAYGYRSRARIQLRGSGSSATTGFFRHRSRQVEDVDACPLFAPPLNEALAAVRRTHRQERPGCDEREVELACADDGRWAFEEKGIRGTGAGTKTGAPLLRKVGDWTYGTTPSVFFQANCFLLEALATTALPPEFGGESALDLYSGVGFFSLRLAARYRRVVAIETDAEAHRLHLENAARASQNNLEAQCADVFEWMKAVSTITAPAFDLVLLDPPRTGAGAEVMRRLAEWGPETLVYVSCDPQTLARDLAALPARSYRIDFVAGLDLFPQTYHFETVVHLKRR